MERKADLPPTTGEGTASRLSSSPPPDFLRHVQAAFKRHKPLGMLPSNVSRARRVLVPQPESMKNVAPISSAKCNNGGNKGFDKFQRDKGKVERERIEQRKTASDSEATPPPVDDSSSSSITDPSATGSVNSTHDENVASFSVQREESKPHGAKPETCVGGGLDCKDVAGYQFDSADGAKRVHISSVGIANSSSSGAPSHRADVRISDDTRINHLSSHLSSIALTESECNLSDRAEPLTLNSQGQKQSYAKQLEITGMIIRPAAAQLPAKTSNLVHEEQPLAFVGKDIVHPMTQSSAAGSSCVTTTSVHSMSAPMLTSTTYNPLSNRDGCAQMEVDPFEFHLNPKPLIQDAPVPPSCPSSQSLNPESVRQTAVSIQLSASAPEASSGILDNNNLSKGQGSVMREGHVFKDGVPDHPKAVCVEEKSTEGKVLLSGASDSQSQASLMKCPSSKMNSEPSQSSKLEKAISGRGTSGNRKKNYDPDVFFKVNGVLYQKLGKIGSGGSSEVFKVISSDCTIYALKKIRLKGRDYSTAYGFCQEIEYLKRLKGKKNIIQLIDYEVTDKCLLAEVMNGSMNIKDGRIKDDGYIYMVLEYGEIDLAHMLSQKWKEMDSSSLEIDENWLRFFWQQILQAVNTIHEERIVHSDLKPANFLLVKGSLKLIDFGIAKAIMSDTTNIQRDAQVGTLNYMSPEAFMWNEHDANGNTIKCGRPSDIWSLGCILYQMVYGRTPFAEYKTFWAKFKVITDRNHVITYDPVSNPLLVDLMKKCLAWERAERWRIPQLLQHPFLVPPIPSWLPTSKDEQCRLLIQMAEAYGHISEVSRMCFQLQQFISNAAPTDSGM